MDGVLADMDAELIRQAEKLFGASAVHDTKPAVTNRQAPAAVQSNESRAAESDAEPAADPESPILKLKLTSKQQRRLWKHVESIENFWETLAEIERGTVKRLARLATDRRWEIIFLTKRPRSAGLTCQLQSQRWLVANGFPLPSVYVVQGSRGRIAAALGLDMVVDDRAENCLDVVVDSKARAVLVWRDDEKLLPPAAKRLGIAVVKTVAECLDVLEQIDAPPREQPGIMNRVMRLLGLAETVALISSFLLLSSYAPAGLCAALQAASPVRASLLPVSACADAARPSPAAAIPTDDRAQTSAARRPCSCV
jgi:hypothetical protein